MALTSLENALQTPWHLAMTVSLKLPPQRYCQLKDGNGNDDTDDNSKRIYGHGLYLESENNPFE